MLAFLYLPLPLQWPAPLCCFLDFECSPQPRKTTMLKYDKPLLTVPYHQPPRQYSLPPPPADRPSPNWANHAAVKRRISFHPTDTVFRKSIALTQLQFWTESRMKPPRTISGRRVGSRFSINLAKIVVFRAGSAFGDSDPSGCEGYCHATGSTLNLKDSRHGHLNQNHLFSVYFPVNIVK